MKDYRQTQYCSLKCQQTNQRAKKYGLTAADLHDLYEDQDHCCGICGKEEDFETFHIDHDHHTGKVRGLLCPLCNIGLGYFTCRKGLGARIERYIGGRKD